MPQSLNNRDIYPLFLKLLENCITDQELQQLNDLFSAHPELVKRYCEFGMNYAAVQMKLNDEVNVNEAEAPGDGFDTQLWAELVRHEKTAPHIEIQQTKSKLEPIQKVAYEKVPARINKLSLITAICSAAALVFFVLLVRLAPQHHSVEMATLIDQIDVKWADSSMNIKNGDRLWTNHIPLCLEKGIVKIKYDDGVEVLVESPAQFTIERSGMYFEYGKLFSHVPQSGLGFRVETPKARFIDQGTDFGVQADINGSAELHVFKGKVQLFAGSGTNAKSSQMLAENKAVRYDADTGITETVPIRTEAFVRSIDSSANLIWRGQPWINLADIVGGGNGFGTGKLDSGIETNTGRWFESHAPDLVQSKIPGILTGGGVYNQVPGLAFIDGVFVPDSRQGPVQITSAGHTFDGFVNGREVFWGNIFNGAWHASDQTLKHQLQLNGQTYGTPQNPAISIHSNQGITFDLQAIRQSIPGGKILRFTSLFGVSETLAQIPSFDPHAGLNSGKVNCWVLIDGKEKFYRNLVSCLHGGIEIEVDINDEDRFVTLVVTESDDRRAYDWALFARPYLLIEMNTN
ncbi:MAG TPA: NPCBM/NEW2 domain-containing protein [Anaerohalosphaeraceae bacterium]|nr:NPCBM/NEW2 domain-containing protein [Anaerohalosphaeraceae bacterium]